MFKVLILKEKSLFLKVVFEWEKKVFIAKWYSLNMVFKYN